MRLAAIVLIALALAFPAAAQPLMDTHLISVVARTAGAGIPPSFWKSDVVIYNPQSAAVTVGLAFFPEGQANQFDDTYPVTREVPAGQSLLLEDVLGSAFGYAGNVKGTLLVSASPDSFPGNPEESAILVASTTYNSGDPRGNYGFAVPTSLLYLNGSATPSYATGGRYDDRYRCNLGIVSASPVATTVHYRIFGADGSIAAEGARTLQAFSMGQWSLADLGVAKQTGPLSAQFWFDPASVTPDPCAAESANYFLAYFSKVDGNPTGTSDGEHIQAVPSEFPPAGFGCPDGEGVAPARRR